MTEYAYYNGVFTPYNSAVIPLSDRSIFFSDAVYDVVVGRGKKAYQLEEHLRRLLGNAERIGLKNLPEISDIQEVTDRLLEIAEADEFMLYIQLSADSERRLHTRQTGGVNLLITVTECEIPKRLGEIKAITLPDMRHSFCDIKTTSLLPAVLSVEEARRRGKDIAIFHKGGTVTECSYANIVLISDGEVIAHPLNSDILPGITQSNIEAAADSLGIRHRRATFTLDEVLSAEAVLISSTTKLVKICTEIDGIMLTVSRPEIAEALFEYLRKSLIEETE